MWHSVDIVDSERASYRTLGLDTVPTAETWDLCGGRRDWEPHLAKLCWSVYLYVCVRDERQVEWVWEQVWKRAQRNTHSLWLCGGVKVWQGWIYHCLAFGQQPSEVKQMEMELFPRKFGHFTSRGVPLFFIMWECIILCCTKDKTLQYLQCFRRAQKYYIQYVCYPYIYKHQEMCNWKQQTNWLRPIKIKLILFMELI